MSHTHEFDTDGVDVISAGEGGFEVESECVGCDDTLYKWVDADEMGVLA